MQLQCLSYKHLTFRPAAVLSASFILSLLAHHHVLLRNEPRVANIIATPAKQHWRFERVTMARSRTNMANKANKIAHSISPPSRRSARIAARQKLEATSTDKRPAKEKNKSRTWNMSEYRRNPKRKATEAQVPNYNIPENLLEEALRPLSASEIEEWEGWIEIESDPVSEIRKEP